MKNTTRLIAALLTLDLWLAARADAAPITLTAELLPGQTGPTYAWSLRLRVDPDYPVWFVAVFTRGWDGIEFNAANPAVDILNSFFMKDGYGDGRDILFVAGNGPLSPAGFDALLGTFRGPSSRAADVALADGELDFGGTFFDLNFINFPPGSFELRVVPEPAPLALLGLALLAGVGRSVPAGRRALVSAPLADRRSRTEPPG